MMRRTVILWRGHRSTSARRSWRSSSAPRWRVTPRARLVRRAVCATFGEQGKAGRLSALKASAGSWRGCGAEYVDAMRGGELNERLGVE